MISAEERDRLVVVLVRARNPANIGAVARAMHDFGFSRLRIVTEYTVPFAAAKSAVDASSVLEAAEEYRSIAEAVADCGLVLGTTAVGERVLQHRLHALHDARGLMEPLLAGDGAAKVAVLFGSEKTGLSNDELSHCHALLTIPMHQPGSADGGQRHLSMNLGQAVAVCLYALGRLEIAPGPSAAEEPASAEDLERVTGLLSEVMEEAGYTRRNPANAREAAVRRLVRRMGLSVNDGALWTGVLRQTVRALKRDARGAGETSVVAGESKRDA